MNQLRMDILGISKLKKTGIEHFNIQDKKTQRDYLVFIIRKDIAQMIFGDSAMT